MSKQPYIPFYVGDYLKDTRALPLSVRGAWVDMILFMWDSPVRGELIGTVQEIARMIGCDEKEAKFALDLLKQKKTADIDLLTTGEFKIVSRRMKRDAEISKKRSEAGISGVKVKFAKAKQQAKSKQNPDIDNDYDNDSIIEIGEKSDFSISIKAKYAHERPRRVYSLAEYFDGRGQLEEIKAAGWSDKFSSFMQENPARVFDDDEHVYNTIKKFKSNGKEKEKAFQIINGKVV